MSAIDDRFAELRSRHQKAFIPFVTAGDPDLATTGRILRLLSDQESSLAEIGFPYSDPIADGPVIQASYTRALTHHLKVDDIFGLTKPLAPQLSMPLVGMVSYAIVLRHGLEAFVDDARSAGFAGLIVPDLLVEESDDLARICRERNVSLIPLITPTTPRDRAVAIARRATGFIYYVSVTGITGERRELPPSIVEQVGWLRTQTQVPICIGFGISAPEHVRMLAPVADGVIVGSALVRQIARLGVESGEVVLPEVSQLIASLQQALRSDG